MVRFECGCIGMKDKNHPDGHIVIKYCGGTDYAETYIFNRRHMLGKSCEPISREEEDAIFKRLARLVSDGHKFRELQRMRGLPVDAP